MQYTETSTSQKIRSPLLRREEAPSSSLYHGSLRRPDSGSLEAVLFLLLSPTASVGTFDDERHGLGFAIPDYRSRTPWERLTLVFGGFVSGRE